MCADAGDKVPAETLPQESVEMTAAVHAAPESRADKIGIDGAAAGPDTENDG